MKKNILLILFAVTSVSWNSNNGYNKTQNVNPIDINSTILKRAKELNNINILIMGNYEEDAINKFVSSMSYYFSTIDSSIKYIHENQLLNYSGKIVTNKGNLEIIKLPIKHGNKMYTFYFNQRVDHTLLLL